MTCILAASSQNASGFPASAKQIPEVHYCWRHNRRFPLAFIPNYREFFR